MEKIKDRIRKLLAQAEDQEGTPEGEAFLDKAFELLAEYGLDRSEVEQSGNAMQREIAIDGSYSLEQAQLLLAIAEALHCVGFSIGPGNGRADSVTIFGLPQHLDRIELLFSMLRLTMLSGAYRVRSHRGIVKARRSFMIGFTERIHERLSAAEETVAEEASGYGLVLIDDQRRALEAQEEFLGVRNIRLRSLRRRNEIDPHAFGRGAMAGMGADIGQKRVSTGESPF